MARQAMCACGHARSLAMVDGFGVRFRHGCGVALCECIKHDTSKAPKKAMALFPGVVEALCTFDGCGKSHRAHGALGNSLGHLFCGVDSVPVIETSPNAKAPREAKPLPGTAMGNAICTKPSPSAVARDAAVALLKSALGCLLPRGRAAVDIEAAISALEQIS